MTEPLLNNNGEYKVIRGPSSDITKRSPYLEQVWNEWENQNSELTTNIMYPTLKRFTSGENILNGRIYSEDDADSITTLPIYNVQVNETTLILVGLNKDDQKYLMIACRQLGLQCIPPATRSPGIFCCCCL